MFYRGLGLIPIALFALVPSLVSVKENSIPMALQTLYHTDLARDTVEFTRSMALGRCRKRVRRIESKINRIICDPSKP